MKRKNNNMEYWVGFHIIYDTLNDTSRVKYVQLSGSNILVLIRKYSWRTIP